MRKNKNSFSVVYFIKLLFVFWQKTFLRNFFFFFKFLQYNESTFFKKDISIKYKYVSLLNNFFLTVR